MGILYKRTAAILLILQIGVATFSNCHGRSAVIHRKSIELSQVARAPSPSLAPSIASPQPSSSSSPLELSAQNANESKKATRHSRYPKLSRKRTGLGCFCKHYWHRYRYKRRCYCHRKRREPTKVWCPCRQKLIEDGTECFPCPFPTPPPLLSPQFTCICNGSQAVDPSRGAEECEANPSCKAVVSQKVPLRAPDHRFWCGCRRRHVRSRRNCCRCNCGRCRRRYGRRRCRRLCRRC